MSGCQRCLRRQRWLSDSKDGVIFCNIVICPAGPPTPQPPKLSSSPHSPDWAWAVTSRPIRTGLTARYPRQPHRPHTPATHKNTPSVPRPYPPRPVDPTQTPAGIPTNHILHGTHGAHTCWMAECFSNPYPQMPRRRCLPQMHGVKGLNRLVPVGVDITVLRLLRYQPLPPVSFIVACFCGHAQARARNETHGHPGHLALVGPERSPAPGWEQAGAD
jgi:hypothetical protein